MRVFHGENEGFCVSVLQHFNGIKIPIYLLEIQRYYYITDTYKVSIAYCICDLRPPAMLPAGGLRSQICCQFPI